MNPESSKKKLKKWTPVHIIRRAVQLISFIFYPGLFIITFSSIGQIVTSLVKGTFTFSGMSQQLILTLAVLLITAIMGRFFCGFLCSFGAMGDLFWFIGRKLKLPKIRVPQKADKILKYSKYVVLAVIIIFSWCLGAFNADGMWSPWTVFGLCSGIKGWKSISSLASIGGALLLVIALASMFVERFFCRYLCPLGAIFVPVSSIRMYRIDKPRKNCGNCHACTANCSMGIPLENMDTIRSGECINCFKCTDICPKDNASADPKPAAAAVAAGASLVGMFYVGNLVGSKTVSTAPSESSYETTAPADTTVQAETTVPDEATDLKDGIYTGSGTGFRGDTTVTVTVKGGKITSISIDSYEDDEQFFSRARSTIIDEIISSQSVDVQTVSGATFSSRGIISAVGDALGIETDYDQSEAPASGSGHFHY